jgi:predicted nucleotidyltransferase
MEKIHNTTKDKILKLLLSSKKDEFTIRAISKKISVDYKATYLIVKELIKSNIIHAKKAGQTILCSINQKEFNADVFRAELIQKKELLSRNKDLYVLHNNFEDIKEPFFILLLFGSYASGKARKGSDIDLMLIADNDEVVKQAQNIISLVPLKIHFFDFSSKEFMSMLKTTEFNVGKEAAANNIILFGIEDYYRLLKKC